MPCHYFIASCHFLLMLIFAADDADIDYWLLILFHFDDFDAMPILMLMLPLIFFMLISWFHFIIFIFTLFRLPLFWCLFYWHFISDIFIDYYFYFHTRRADIFFSMLYFGFHYCHCRSADDDCWCHYFSLIIFADCFSDYCRFDADDYFLSLADADADVDFLRCYAALLMPIICRCHFLRFSFLCRRHADAADYFRHADIAAFRWYFSDDAISLLSFISPWCWWRWCWFSLRFWCFLFIIDYFDVIFFDIDAMLFRWLYFDDASHWLFLWCFRFSLRCWYFLIISLPPPFSAADVDADIFRRHADFLSLPWWLLLIAPHFAAIYIDILLFFRFLFSLMIFAFITMILPLFRHACFSAYMMFRCCHYFRFHSHFIFAIPLLMIFIIYWFRFHYLFIFCLPCWLFRHITIFYSSFSSPWCHDYWLPRFLMLIIFFIISPISSLLSFFSRFRFRADFAMSHTLIATLLSSALFFRCWCRRRWLMFIHAASHYYLYTPYVITPASALFTLRRALRDMFIVARQPRTTSYHTNGRTLRHYADIADITLFDYYCRAFQLWCCWYFIAFRLFLMLSLRLRFIWCFAISAIFFTAIFYLLLLIWCCCWCRCHCHYADFRWFLSLIAADIYFADAALMMLPCHTLFSPLFSWLRWYFQLSSFMPDFDAFRWPAAAPWFSRFLSMPLIIFAISTFHFFWLLIDFFADIAITPLIFIDDFLYYWLLIWCWYFLIISFWFYLFIFDYLIFSFDADADAIIYYL